MRYALIVLWMLLWSVTSAIAQVSVGIGLPSVSIGISLPLFPQLVQVPGYPVYYAPQLDSNYFFYDGMYWVYERDNWYASSWYNGPWGFVDPEVVPLFVLRVPVRYYRAPPVYFRGWRSDSAPRWGDHWGNQWQQHRSGWDNWNRSSVPALAPLPVYQRQYSGARYPRVEQQQAIHNQNYRYQPRDAVVQQHVQERATQGTPASAQRGRQETPQEKSPRQQQNVQRPASPQQGGPASPRPQQSQRGGEDVQRPAPTTQAPPQQRGTGAQGRDRQPQQNEDQRERQAPSSGRENAPQDRGAPQESRRGQGQDQRQERDRGEKGEERGQERNR